MEQQPDQLDQDAQARFDELKPFFTADGFEHERPQGKNQDFLATGLNGVVFILREKLPDGKLGRRFIAKYTIQKKTHADLKRELKITPKLYGALHIVQPIIDNGKLRQLKSVPDTEHRINREGLFTEFLPNGTLKDLIENRTGEYAKIPVPNRVLWMIFRCLVRIVMALAKPPNKPLGKRNEVGTLESLPEREPRDWQHDCNQIEHGDLKYFNVVFGDLDGEEHTLVPILKAIDFGKAQGGENEERRFKSKTAGTPTQKNIHGIGKIMEKFWKHRDPSMDKNIILQNLDSELMALVERCISKSPSSRPKLKELFEKVQACVEGKTGPAAFEGEDFKDWESDEKIREYVKATILKSE